MPANFDIYLRRLRETASKENTEHTGRGALETLLGEFAGAEGISVVHEPKRERGFGAPDFKIISRGMILGYVEAKPIGTNLHKELKSDQFVKYRALSENILVTDYLQWIWLDSKTGKPRVDPQILAFESDLDSRTIRLNPERAKAVEKLIAAFFSQPPQGIGQSQQLALALATRSKLLRDFLIEELMRQSKAQREGRLHALFEVFKAQIFHELELKEFADAFAQMLAYGLFLAKLNAGANVTIRLDNVRAHIPLSFRLIRELVRFLEDMNEPEYRQVRWVVDEVLSIVNGLELDSLMSNLSFRQRKAISRNVRAEDEEEHRLFERDPYIYFYEDFLKAYDKEMRKSRGVYYTPPPVVNFIIRAIDDILKDRFEIADGLADHKRVTVLDFACGTGTFLLEVFERIFENIGGPKSGKADLVVREHLLRNLYGFEYLIAPYTIAHLKLSQYLKDRGHPLEEAERLQVFLTNTLEPIEPQANLMLPAVTEEVRAAQDVKDRPILVITGNPPYSGHSKNKGAWISAAINAYKQVDGKPLGEKNPKWLQDDYVKFIRFAQMKMDSVEEGVVGIITNHSWLDNPTFRGMRQSLSRTFNQIWILDLHGSTKPKERVPDGVENENVFDIQKGVAVSLFVKRPGLARGIWYAELWGNRIDKYRATAAAQFVQIDWRDVPSSEPYYMFRPLDWSGWDTYRTGWPVADALSSTEEKREIFTINVLGFQTHRDHFAVAFSRDDIERRVRDFIDHALSEQDLSEKYDIKNNRDWNLKDARITIRNTSDWKRRLIDCAYRPFDVRSCLFGYEFMDYPRRELIDNVADKENFLLLVSRQIGVAEWRHIYATQYVPESCCVSDGTTEQNYCFPTFKYIPESNQRTENFSTDFRKFLDARYDHHYTPEEIIGYIYAVLHAPAYRRRYMEFLRIDFPRVPFPKSREQFDRLSKLGSALIGAHLLRKLTRKNLAKHHGVGSYEVETVRYSPQEQAIWINRRRNFAPVPQDVWDFHIGGYQVLDKYLKSRKGRELVLDEVNHVSTVADTLAFTISQMAEIDASYGAAFPSRG